jgi:hypothetical protein
MELKLSRWNLRVLALLLGCAPALAGDEVDWQGFVDRSKTTLFGRSACLTIDLNRDGLRDYAVGAAFAGPDGARTGSVVILSGVDLSILSILRGPSQRVGFGMRVIGGMGDRDGDGEEDLIVESFSGPLWACSVRKQELFSCFSKPQSYRGDVPGSLGDLDGYGVQELVLRGADWDSGRTAFSRASDRDAELDRRGRGWTSVPSQLLGLRAFASSNHLGSNVLTPLGPERYGCTPFELRTFDGLVNPKADFAIADFDGDQQLDFAFVPVSSEQVGSGKRVYRSRTNTSEALRTSSLSGSFMVAVPDLDEDGGCELAVLDQCAFGELIVFSGTTLMPLWRQSVGELGLGEALELVPDRDADGVADLLVGSGDLNFYHGPVNADGVLSLHSSRTGAVLAQVKEAALRAALSR